MVMPYGPLNPDPNSPGQMGQMGQMGLTGLRSMPAPAPQAPLAPVITPEQVAAARSRIGPGPATQAAQTAIAENPATTPVRKRTKAQEFAASPYLAQSLLAASKGFFDGDMGEAFAGFSKGLAGFDASRMKTSELGGPDNAFEIVTDPSTGARTYRPVQAIQDYLTTKREAEFRKAHTPKAPDQKDVADMIGRAASFVQQGGDANEARRFLVANGIPEEAIPQVLSPAYSAFGATVPQAQAQATRQAAQAYREKSGDRQFEESVKQHGISNGFRAQANSRANAAAARAAKGGSKGGRKGLGSKLPAGFILN